MVVNTFITSGGPAVISLLVLKNGNLVSLSTNYFQVWNINDGTLIQSRYYYFYYLVGSKLQNNYLVVQMSYDSKNYIEILNANDFTVVTDFNSLRMLTTPLKNGYFASTSEENIIKIWNGNFGLQKTIVSQVGIYSIAELQNGYLAGGDANGAIKIWNVTDGYLKKSIAAHNGNVNLLFLLNNGNLASVGAENTIKIWNVTDGSLKKTLVGHNSTISFIQQLSNNNLVSVSNNIIKIWNVVDGSLISSLEGHSSTINNLIVLQNGYLASGSSDKTIKIWGI